MLNNMENIVKIEVDGIQFKLFYSENGKLDRVSSKDGKNLTISVHAIQVGLGYKLTEDQCDVTCVFIPKYNIYLPMYLFIKL